MPEYTTRAISCSDRVNRLDMQIKIYIDHIDCLCITSDSNISGDSNGGEVTTGINEKILTMLKSIERKIKIQGDTMALDFTRLERTLEQQTDANAAASQLMTAMFNEIKTISANSKDPETQARLDEFASNSEMRTQALIDAVFANTNYAAPPPQGGEPPQNG